MTVTDKFRPSLVARASKRTVSDGHTGTFWIVDGEPKLGDTRFAYNVTLLPTKRYHCDCYDSANGDVRARRICSHVLAVIQHKERQRAENAPSTIASKPRNGSPMGADSASFTAESGVGGRNTAESQVPLAAPPASDAVEGITRASVVPSPRDSIFRGKVPEWVEEIRPHQWDAVEECVDGFRSGCKAVFVDAPTGSGKTLIGRMTSALLNQRSLYICSDKSLQDQFVRDFPSAILKGRANYTPAGWDDVNCGDCTLTSFEDDDCSWCDEANHCPYTVAKRTAIRHELAVLNTSYLLAEGNANKTAFGVRQRGLVIVDEADCLERELMGYVTAEITERRAKELGIGKPQFVTKPDSIAEWVGGVVLPRIKVALGKASEALEDAHDAPQRTKLRTIRQRNGLIRLLDSFRLVEGGLRSGNWIFDGYKNGGAIFKPVRVNPYGPDALWRHADRWLMMSATIISADELADSLGLDGVYRTVTVPMTFPVSNRRIHVAGVANMSAKLKDAEWPRMARGIARILEIHPDERILIHVNSYALADFLDAQLLDRRVMTYRAAREREATLAKFRSTPSAVLLAPSMERGVDLKDDDCRVVVVAKIPFPYLGDKQVSARLHSQGGQQWYAVQTCRALVQMTGRAVRSDKDFATNYILDSAFTSNIWKNSRGLLPAWWVESINWEYPTRTLR